MLVVPLELRNVRYLLMYVVVNLLMITFMSVGCQQDCSDKQHIVPLD